MIKGKGQRLIPEELLKYLESLKNKYPNAVDLIEANPTLEGGEDSLSSVLINGTKYSVGGGGATLEDIVDSAGNKRFIEGNGTPGTHANFNVTYCKWSLSGTHLMLVCAGSVKSTSISNGFNFATFPDIPEWVLEKIVPSYNTYYIEGKKVLFHDGGGTPQELMLDILKYNGITIKFTDTGTTFSTENFFRIQFDLLIDADYS